MIKNISVFLKEIFNKVFGGIFNTKCCICGCIKTHTTCVKNDEILCENCVKQLEFYTNNEHRIFDGVVINSIIKYDGFAKEVVKKLKFQYKKDISKTLARLVSERFNPDIKYIVVPTPAHKARLRKYGFNHVESVCREFCKIKGYKTNKNILSKNRETLTQHFLNKEQRFKNVKNSFKVNLKKYNGENLLIIDDITTTGATMDEIIKTFKKESIDNIICLTVFR